MLQFQVTPNVLFIFPKTPRCKCNKTNHTQLLGALLKNSGLASQGDMAKLDWFIIENIFKINFYKFSKNFFWTQQDGIVYLSLQEYVN